MAVTVNAQHRPHGLSTPALIRVAGASAALGIGASLTEYAEVGTWLTVAGVLLLILGLHRFGRSGPDEAIVFGTEARPRRKKKKLSKADVAEGSASPHPPADGGS